MKYIAIESYGKIVKGRIYDVREVHGWHMLFCVTDSVSLDYIYLDNEKFKSLLKPYNRELPQPHKSLLKDGDYVIDREGTEYIVSVKFGKLIDKETDFMEFDDIDDELTDEEYTVYDIMEIYRDGELIAKRKNDNSTENDEKDELKNALKSLKEMVVKIEDLIK